MNAGWLIFAAVFWLAAWALNEWLVRLQPASPAVARAIGLAVPLIFGVAVLVVWEGVVRGFEVPSILLPAPSMIWDRLTASGPTLWADLQQTFFKAVLIGYALGCGAGFVVAILIDRSPFLQRGLLPLGNFVSRAADRRHRADHGDVVRLRLAVQGRGRRGDDVLPDAGEHRAGARRRLRAWRAT